MERERRQGPVNVLLFSPGMKLSYLELVSSFQVLLLKFLGRNGVWG